MGDDNILRILSSYLIGLFVLALCYGSYVVLFGTSVHLLCSGHTKGCRLPSTQKLLLSATITFFVMSTVLMGFYFAFVYSSVIFVLRGEIGGFVHAVDRMVPITLSVMSLQIMIADGLLLWRCYVLWNKNRKLLIIGLVMITFETILGILLSANIVLVDDGLLYFPILLLTNIIMSCLIAGRILWLRGKTCVMGNEGTKRRYRHLPWLILECGISYWICLVLAIISQYTDRELETLNILVSAVLAAGIFSTLLIVLVELGKSTGKDTSIVISAPIRFASATHAVAPSGDHQNLGTVLDLDSTVSFRTDSRLDSIVVSGRKEETLMQSQDPVYTITGVDR